MEGVRVRRRLFPNLTLFTVRIPTSTIVDVYVYISRNAAPDVNVFTQTGVALSSTSLSFVASADATESSYYYVYIGWPTGQGSTIGNWYPNSAISPYAFFKKKKKKKQSHSVPHRYFTVSARGAQSISFNSPTEDTLLNTGDTFATSWQASSSVPVGTTVTLYLKQEAWGPDVYVSMQSQ